MEELTDELHLLVFSSLDLEDLVSVQLCCKKWYRICSDNSIWRRLYYQRFKHRPHRFTLAVGGGPHVTNDISGTSRSSWVSRNEAKCDWKSFFRLRYNWQMGKCKIHTLLLESRLVAVRNKQVVSIDSSYRLTIRTLDDLLLASCNLKQWTGNDLGSPSAIVVNQAGTFKICVGFDTGSFAVLVYDGDSSIGCLHIKSAASGRHQGVKQIVQKQNLLAVYTEKANVILYSFEPKDPPIPSNHKTKGDITWGETKTVFVLKSYLHTNLEVSFSLRSLYLHKHLLSLAYFEQTLSGEFIPIIQEILCTSDGSILNTRKSSYYTSTNNWSHEYSTRPVSLSYSHPYILAGFSNGSMSLYIARSAECCLEVQPRQRSWGHGGQVMVRQGGTAVSVGTKEIKWWELASGISYRITGENQQNVIQGSQVGEFMTFDEEMIMVEMKNKESRYLMICDFR